MTLDKTQIAKLVSDARTSSSYQSTGEEGRLVTVDLIEFATIDDLMVQGMKNVAATIKFSSVEYVSVADNRDIVTEMTRVHIPIVGS